MVKMDNTPTSGCGTSPMNPSPEIYLKRSISTSCLDLQMFGSPHMVPMAPRHHRSTSDPFTFISVAPSMNLHQADTEMIDLKMDSDVNADTEMNDLKMDSDENPDTETIDLNMDFDENTSEPTIEEYMLYAKRAFLQQKIEYIDNLSLLTAKIKMTVDALERNVGVLKRLTAKYIDVKKERDTLLYILSKIHKGK